MVETPASAASNTLEPLDNPLRWVPLPTTGPAAIPDKNWDNALGDEKYQYSKQSKERTHRHPTTKEPEGSVDRMNKVVNMRREDNLRYVLNLILSKLYKNFDNFATDAQDPGGDYDKITSGSIEAYHNDYHVIIGGMGGHMSNVPIAAHDPLFWMHHGMVDRVFALWQLINPHLWLPDPSPIPGKASKNLSPLIPFKAPTDGGMATTEVTKDSFWTAGHARNTRKLGYYFRGCEWGANTENSEATSDLKDTNPEFPGFTEAEIALSEKTRNYVKDNYEWGRRLYNVPYGKNPWPIYDLKTNTHFFNYGNLAGSEDLIKQLPSLEGEEPTYKAPNEGGAFSREWYIDNKVGRLALNGAFTIFWFIDLSPDRIDSTPPSDYITLPSVAGVSHIFAAPTEVCDNCARQEQQAAVVKNTTPITATLLDYVDAEQLESLDPEHVVQFLVAHLSWRIVSGNGELVDPSQVENFAVNVTVKATPLPRGSKDPIYIPYPQVARGIAKNQRIEAFDRKHEEKRKILEQELDEEANWAIVGSHRLVDHHESEFRVREKRKNKNK